METMTKQHELYRAECNGKPVLRVSAEVPAWAPRPQLPSRPWLRWVLASALQRWWRTA